MIITNKVNMDLRQPGFLPAIHAVQNDRYCRNLELSLLFDGEAWMLPEGMNVLIRYSKADGTGGEYDTLPDGTVAWTAEENRLTVALAPQVLTVPGPVHLSVSLIVGSCRLTTFSLLLNVHEEVCREIGESEAYVHVTGFLPQPAKGAVGQFFQVSAVDAQGRITAVEAVDVAGASGAVLYTQQELTEGQKQQSRQNIGAVTVGDVVTALEGSTETVAVNLLEGVTWKAGYLTGYSSGVKTALDSLIYGDSYTEDLVPVVEGKTYTLKYTPLDASMEAWWAIQEYQEDGSFARTVLALTDVLEEGESKTYSAMYTPGDNVTGIRLCGRTYAWYGGVDSTGMTQEEYDTAAHQAGQTVFSMTDSVTVATGDMRLLPVAKEADLGKTMQIRDGQWMMAYGHDLYENPNIRAVNHRGYCTAAPENTLSAFRLSKKMGFSYVECDVSFTSDNVPVLLHDSTVDRTSNGSGSISAMSLEQVKALDFGSWMGEEYTGEQIPTFEEFMVLCKQIGLHPYIEIKGVISTDAVQILLNTVKRCGMQGKVTWISFYETSLERVKAADTAARLGYITESAAESTINIANSLKTGENQVFLDVSESTLTETFVEQCVESDIPVEVWTVNNAANLAAMDPYVSGYTSDVLCGNAVLYETFG